LVVNSTVASCGSNRGSSAEITTLVHPSDARESALATMLSVAGSWTSVESTHPEVNRLSNAGMTVRLTAAA
jgi:hypothetical protein